MEHPDRVTEDTPDNPRDPADGFTGCSRR